MKTKIIIEKEWREIVEYDFILRLSKGDYLDFEDTEYKVVYVNLDIDNNVIEIVIEEY